MRSGFIYNPPQHPLDIIFEDHDLIVVDKPAGLLSVMGRLPEHQDSAYLRVLTMYPEARVTHRLDMATSGLLMFAKHRDAEVAMSKLFQLRRIKKNTLRWCKDAPTPKAVSKHHSSPIGQTAPSRKLILKRVNLPKPYMRVWNIVLLLSKAVCGLNLSLVAHISSVCISCILVIRFWATNCTIRNRRILHLVVWHYTPHVLV